MRASSLHVLTLACLSLVACSDGSSQSTTSSPGKASVAPGAGIAGAAGGRGGAGTLAANTTGGPEGGAKSEPGAGAAGIPAAGGNANPGSAGGGNAGTSRAGNATQGGNPSAAGAPGAAGLPMSAGSPGSAGRPNPAGSPGTAWLPNSAGSPGTAGTSGGATPVSLHGQLKVVGTELQDANGQPYQLKGVSGMWLNWESKGFAESKPALQYMRDSWKLSVIRAPMGIDATGGYLTSAANQAKMQTKVETIVQNAIDLGVYVIVDWHTEKAVNQQADAIAFFTAMAQKYGKYPNVIWEPYNEPNGFTWAQIKPYHQAVVNAIRAVDPDNLIVMGTPKWSQDVDLAAADPVSGTNLLYTLHFYACSHQQWLRTKADTALSKGAALFITEFGATPADGGVVSKNDAWVCPDETQAWFTWMAQKHVSGASWKLEQCTDTSCILTSNAPLDGPWTDNYLTATGTTLVKAGTYSGGGHGQLVVNWIRQ